MEINVLVYARSEEHVELKPMRAITHCRDLCQTLVGEMTEQDRLCRRRGSCGGECTVKVGILVLSRRRLR